MMTNMTNEEQKQRKKENNKKHYILNKEKKNLASKKYALAHPEKIKNLQAQWYILNKESVLLAQKEYQKTPKSRFASGKANAKKRKIEWTIAFEEYVSLISQSSCHYCNRLLNLYGSGLDRKDASKNYSFDNVVPCCARCNSTFMDHYSYEAKIILSEAIKKIDKRGI